MHGTFFVIETDHTFLSFPLESISNHLLHRQQVRLGLLKAARVLFSRQENLRRVLLQTVVSTDSSSMENLAGSADEDATPDVVSPPPSLLMQQLMSAATQPSPIKGLFNREELEVRNDSCCVRYEIIGYLHSQTCIKRSP